MPSGVARTHVLEEMSGGAPVFQANLDNQKRIIRAVIEAHRQKNDKVTQADIIKSIQESNNKKQRKPKDVPFSGTKNFKDTDNLKKLVSELFNAQDTEGIKDLVKGIKEKRPSALPRTIAQQVMRQLNHTQKGEKSGKKGKGKDKKSKKKQQKRKRMSYLMKLYLPIPNQVKSAKGLAVLPRLIDFVLKDPFTVGSAAGDGVLEDSIDAKKFILEKLTVNSIPTNKMDVFHSVFSIQYWQDLVKNIADGPNRSTRIAVADMLDDNKTLKTRFETALINRENRSIYASRKSYANDPTLTRESITDVDLKDFAIGTGELFDAQVSMFLLKFQHKHQQLEAYMNKMKEMMNKGEFNGLVARTVNEELTLANDRKKKKDGSDNQGAAKSANIGKIQTISTDVFVLTQARMQLRRINQFYSTIKTLCLLTRCKDTNAILQSFKAGVYRLANTSDTEAIMKHMTELKAAIDELQNTIKIKVTSDTLSKKLTSLLAETLSFSGSNGTHVDTNVSDLLSDARYHSSAEVQKMLWDKFNTALTQKSPTFKLESKYQPAGRVQFDERAIVLSATQKVISTICDSLTAPVSGKGYNFCLKTGKTYVESLHTINGISRANGDTKTITKEHLNAYGIIPFPITSTNSVHVPYASTVIYAFAVNTGLQFSNLPSFTLKNSYITSKDMNLFQLNPSAVMAVNTGRVNDKISALEERKKDSAKKVLITNSLELQAFKAPKKNVAVYPGTPNFIQALANGNSENKGDESKSIRSRQDAGITPRTSDGEMEVTEDD